MKKYLQIYRDTRNKDKSLNVEVVIMERRQGKFGRPEVLVTPMTGNGELWMDERCLYEKDQINENA